jgi:hypothetical protein
MYQPIRDGQKYNIMQAAMASSADSYCSIRRRRSKSVTTQSARQFLGA